MIIVFIGYCFIPPSVRSRLVLNSVHFRILDAARTVYAGLHYY